MESIQRYWKRTDKTYLLLCILSSSFAVLALSSWAAKQGSGFALDDVTGQIVGIGDYRRAVVQAGAAAIGLCVAVLLSNIDYRSLVKVWPVHVAVTWGMVLPTLLIGQIRRVIVLPLLLSLIEAAVKIGIFILYLFAISRMSDIRRVFEYHGAEHKTIACYEAGDELTPENAAKYTRFHPRCGTSFILIVIIVSVLVFSLVSWDNLAVRIALKLICLPLVVGIAYEIIKLAGRYNNFCTRFISAPGLWLQRLTTREPDSTQLEIAIAAMKPCIPENQDEDRW